MTLWIIAGSLAMFMVPALLNSIGKKMEPGTWAKLVTASLVSGAFLFEFGFLLISAPPILSFIGFSNLAAICRHMLGDLSPLGAPLAVGAVAVSIFVPISIFIHLSTTRRAVRASRIEFGVGSHSLLQCGSSLVILPESRAFGVSIPGEPDQIIVSQGLIDSLDGEELEMVCDHEAAHLRLKHSKYLTLCAAFDSTFRFNPVVKVSTKVLRVALERWADETAAGDSLEKRLKLRSALISVALIPQGKYLATFSKVEGLMERIEALEAHSSHPFLLWWLVLLMPGITFTSISGVVINSWGTQMYCALSMASHC